MADPIEFETGRTVRPECAHCAELLADAVDDLQAEADGRPLADSASLLTPGDRAFFDRHLAGCTDCMAALADAQRGAAWLQMLKAPRPEPSTMLFERILAQTSGAERTQVMDVAAHHAGGQYDGQFGAVLQPVLPLLPGRVLPFRPQAPLAMPMWARVNRVLFEPRLAMTAAMAFFSIALTMSLTGVRLDQLHARDLKPAALKRSYYEATASVARSYEGLRVVHVLESRVDDLRENSDFHGLHADRPGSWRESESSSRRDRKADTPQPAPETPEPERKPERRPDGHGVSQQERAPEPQPNPRRQPLFSARYTVAPARSMAKEGGLA